MRERVLDAKYASMDVPYGPAGLELMSAAVNRVRSGDVGAGPNIQAKGMRVTAEEVMTTRLIEGVRWAALRMERVPFTAGSIMSRL